MRARKCGKVPPLAALGGRERQLFDLLAGYGS